VGWITEQGLPDFSLTESIGTAFEMLSLAEVKVSGLGPRRVLPGTRVERVRELRSMPYDEFLTTPEWHYTTQTVKQWAHNRCQLCGVDQGLNGHHLTYERRGGEIGDDLLVVCFGCHRAIHRMTDRRRF
jgi:hypothetical protein